MQEEMIKVEKGEEVATIYHEADSNKWIFFCHGFGSDKEGSYKKRCERMVENGWNAVRFDFRGNGDSDGDFIDQDLSSRIEDLKAVVDYFGPENYCLFGSSFGGKTVLHATTSLDPEAVIGRAPVTYNNIMEKYRAVVDNKGTFTHHEGATIDERFYKDFDTYSFEELANKIEIPVAIFHGRSDTTVHPEKSIQAVGELEADTMLELLEDENHSFSEEAEHYMLEQMTGFLKTQGF